MVHDDDAHSGHDDNHGVRDVAVDRDDDGDDDDRRTAAVVVRDDDDDDGAAADVRVHGVHGDYDGVPSAIPNGCQRGGRRDVVAALFSLLIFL